MGIAGCRLFTSQQRRRLITAGCRYDLRLCQLPTLLAANESEEVRASRYCQHHKQVVRGSPSKPILSTHESCKLLWLAGRTHLFRDPLSEKLRLSPRNGSAQKAVPDDTGSPKASAKKHARVRGSPSKPLLSTPRAMVRGSPGRLLLSTPQALQKLLQCHSAIGVKGNGVR